MFLILMSAKNILWSLIVESYKQLRIFSFYSNLCFKRYTSTLSIFSFGIYAVGFHMIATCSDSDTKFQCWSIAAVFIAFYASE